jgi:3-oxoacyl-[acyl-carrier protein] reductase
MTDRDHLAVITGGTGSLGTALAEALQVPGWTVSSPCRQDLDVRDEASIRRYFRGRKVDLLVCAAGIVRDAPVARLTEDAWNETWSVNFFGATRCAEAVIPRMREAGGGHIVFISSFSALHPPVGQVAYASAKAALLGLAADLASRHGSANIRVNAVLPGFLETRMTEAVAETRRGEILGDHVLGRFNTCRQAAAFVHFLHHHLPDTSGQTFQLDSRPAFR